MSNIIPFIFGTLPVRAVLRDGEPWFVAADVCAVLEIVDVRQAVDRLDDAERGGCTVPTPGGAQEVRAVNESGLYALIFTSRKPEAQRFRRWVTGEVLPSIRKTGQYSPQPTPPATFTAPKSVEAALLADAISTALRLEGSARLGMLHSTMALHAPENLPLLPHYAVDAPRTVVALGSSQPTVPLTELLKQHRVMCATNVANQVLATHGLLEQRTRRTSKGTEKAFWCVTEAGTAYGKNITSAANPRETQPHWFASTGADLLRAVGLLTPAAAAA